MLQPARQLKVQFLCGPIHKLDPLVAFRARHRERGKGRRLAAHDLAKLVEVDILLALRDLLHHLAHLFLAHLLPRAAERVHKVRRCDAPLPLRVEVLEHPEQVLVGHPPRFSPWSKLRRCSN